MLANFIRELNTGTILTSTVISIWNPPIYVFTIGKFCSYSRLIKQREEGWALSMKEMLDVVKKYDGEPVTEVHIVGGVLPQYDVAFIPHCSVP